MITELKPYRTNMPSGVKWLGDVPEHWEARRLRTIAHIINGATPSTNNPAYWDGNINWITPDDLGRLTTINITDCARRITHEGYKSCGTNIAAVGSLAISTRAPIGHIGVLQFDACVNQGCRLLTPTETCSVNYLYYMLKTTRSELESFGQGSTFTELSRGKLDNFRIPLPPLPEQTAIVRYLDHADRRIQRYISGKQKLIKLLEEQKQAIIHRAVTRGLDPNVSLKPSGVEWLGDVPEHWEVVGLKFLSRRIQNGATPSTVETRYYETGSIPWYGPSSCRYKEKVDSPVRYLTADAFKEGKARLIHGPALLVIVIGATAGRLALLTEDGSTNQQITSFELNTVLVHPLFILRQARSAEHWLRATASTATIPILDTGVVSRLSVAFPPLPEQTVIVEHLDKTTANIDTAINRARRQIELLSEYHTRLIADVVTGKLDVRDADISASGEVPTLNGIDDLEEKTEPDEVDVMEEIYGDD